MADLKTLCIDETCSSVSDSYTKTEVNELLDALNTGKFLVVDSLPPTGEDKTIYLVSNDGGGQNIYDEYIWVSGAFEKIGTTDIDLSQYYTKIETNDLLDDKQDALIAGNNITIENNVISSTATGGGRISDVLELDVEDSYNMGSDHDIPTFIESKIDLSLINSGMGDSPLKWKTPELKVEHGDWSEPDADLYQTATGTVRVLFADGSSLSKTVTFISRANGPVYAAKPKNGAYIDTGLTLNYVSYITVMGHTKPRSQSVLVGAFQSTSERTTLRILGGGNSVQHMWPANQQISTSDAGIDFNKMFGYTQNKAGIELWQGDEHPWIAAISSQKTSGTADVPVLLFNETPTADFNRGTIRYANIGTHDSGMLTTLRMFRPYHLNGEIVMLDINNLTSNAINDIMENGDNSEYANRIYRPVVGNLVEVTQAEDEGE